MKKLVQLIGLALITAGFYTGYVNNTEEPSLGLVAGIFALITIVAACITIDRNILSFVFELKEPKYIDVPKPVTSFLNKGANGGMLRFKTLAALQKMSRWVIVGNEKRNVAAGYIALTLRRVKGPADEVVRSPNEKDEVVEVLVEQNQVRGLDLFEQSEREVTFRLHEEHRAFLFEVAYLRKEGVRVLQPIAFAKGHKVKDFGLVTMEELRKRAPEPLTGARQLAQYRQLHGR